MDRPVTMQDSPQQPAPPLGVARHSRQRELAVLSRTNHDIRSPLSVIFGVLELLDDAGTLSDAERRYLKLGLKAAGELQVLADSLRLYAGLERGYVKLERATVHLAGVMRRNLTEAFAAKGVAVVPADGAAASALVWADPAYLAVAVASLGRYLASFVADAGEGHQAPLWLQVGRGEAGGVTVTASPAGVCPPAATRADGAGPEPDEIAVVNALRLVDLMGGSVNLAPSDRALAITLPAAESTPG